MNPLGDFGGLCIPNLRFSVAFTNPQKYIKSEELPLMYIHKQVQCLARIISVFMTMLPFHFCYPKNVVLLLPITCCKLNWKQTLLCLKHRVGIGGESLYFGELKQNNYDNITTSIN